MKQQNVIRKYIPIEYTIFVIFPFIILFIYFGFMESDRYVSHSKLTVRTVGSFELQSSALSGLLGGGASDTDLGQVNEYIKSSDMLDVLQKKYDLRKIFSSPAIDRTTRMRADAPFEDFLTYYQNMLSLKIDNSIGVLTIDTEGFTPKQAYEINGTITKQVEIFMNETSHSVAREQVQYVEEELEKAQIRLNGVRKKMADFLKKNKTLSPQKEGTVQSTVLAELQKNLAEEQTKQKTLMSFMRPDAPEMVTVRARIGAILEQMNAQKDQFSEKNGAVTNMIAGYEPLEAEMKFVTRIYEMTLSALEKARIEASRKVKNVITVQSATLPEKATKPERLPHILLSFLLLNFMYGIGKLVVSSIKDHMD